MAAERPSITPYGDAALLVSFEQRIEPAINAQVQQLAELVNRDRLNGAPWSAPIPAYASLLVPFDPLRIQFADAEARVSTLIGRLSIAARAVLPRPVLTIPVRYGGDYGPDLAEVADRAGLTPAQVIELHSGTTYRAYMLGFAPGFAYLGTLPEVLRLPRRSTPRQRVPAGSVAIAAAQTAVYPLATPGGWHLIGRTDAIMWDANREPPALVEAGRDVRFEPVTD